MCWSNFPGQNAARYGGLGIGISDSFLMNTKVSVKEGQLQVQPAYFKCQPN